MIRYSVWPVGKDNADRLKQFHQSQYWPDEEGALRRHDVSAFWLSAVKNIHTSVHGSSIIIDSLSHYIGPQQLEEKRKRSKAQRQRLLSRVVLFAGKMGKHVPRIVWTAPAKLAQTTLRVHSIADEERAREVAKKGFLKAFESNPDTIISLDNLDRVPVLAEQSQSSLWMALYIASLINILSPYIRDFNIRKIMEIGPGWGVLAISLHHFFNCRFILIDLPEVLSATFTMLSYYCPSSIVALPNEIEEARIDSRGSDFILLCPEQTSLIPHVSLDLAINTSSFQEMTYPIIEEYFRLIKKCLRNGGFFYCMNEKVFKRHRVGGPIEIEKYPWDPEFRDIFYEEFAFGCLSESYERIRRLQVKCAGGDSDD